MPLIDQCGFGSVDCGAGYIPMGMQPKRVANQKNDAVLSFDNRGDRGVVSQFSGGWCLCKIFALFDLLVCGSDFFDDLRIRVCLGWYWEWDFFGDDDFIGLDPHRHFVG